MSPGVATSGPQYGCLGRQSFSQPACPMGGFSCPWATALAQSLHLWGLSTASFGPYAIHLGSPQASGGQPTPPGSSSWAAGGLLLQSLEHLLLLPHWPWCLRDSFSHIFSPFSPSCCCTVFFPFLKFAPPGAQPALLIGSALASSGSPLELAGTGFYLTWGSFQALLTEAISAAPCYQTLATWNQYSMTLDG